MTARPSMRAALAGLTVAALSTSAFGAAYTINWMNQAPTPFGSSVPNNSVFNLPGIGPVTVTYTMPQTFVDSRGTNALHQNGSVTSGPDTYSWGPHETFGATSFAPNPPFQTTSWSITYSFTNTVAPGTLYLGVMGLGRTSSFGGGMSLATVNQNGQFLGDWISGGNYGATQFTGGAGIFTMNNSVTGIGGADPHWNTELGVVKILDPVNSLTVHIDQLPGDGLGLNIGSVVPAPGEGMMLVLAGVAALGRRRRD